MESLYALRQSAHIAVDIDAFSQLLDDALLADDKMVHQFARDAINRRNFFALLMKPAADDAAQCQCIWTTTATSHPRALVKHAALEALFGTHVLLVKPRSAAPLLVDNVRKQLVDVCDHCTKKTNLDRLLISIGDLCVYCPRLRTLRANARQKRPADSEPLAPARPTKKARTEVQAEEEEPASASAPAPVHPEVEPVPATTTAETNVMNVEKASAPAAAPAPVATVREKKTRKPRTEAPAETTTVANKELEALDRSVGATLRELNMIDNNTNAFLLQYKGGAYAPFPVHVALVHNNEQLELINKLPKMDRLQFMSEAFTRQETVSSILPHLAKASKVTHILGVGCGFVDSNDDQCIRFNAHTADKAPMFRIVLNSHNMNLVLFHTDEMSLDVSVRLTPKCDVHDTDATPTIDVIAPRFSRLANSSFQLHKGISIVHFKNLEHAIVALSGVKHVSGYAYTHYPIDPVSITCPVGTYSVYPSSKYHVRQQKRVNKRNHIAKHCADRHAAHMDAVALPLPPSDRPTLNGLVNMQQMTSSLGIARNTSSMLPRTPLATRAIAQAVDCLDVHIDEENDRVTVTPIPSHEPAPHFTLHVTPMGCPLVVIEGTALVVVLDAKEKKVNYVPHTPNPFNGDHEVAYKMLYDHYEKRKGVMTFGDYEKLHTALMHLFGKRVDHFSIQHDFIHYSRQKMDLLAGRQ